MNRKLIPLFLLVLSICFPSYFFIVQASDCNSKEGVPYREEESRSIYYMNGACQLVPILNAEIYFSHFDSWDDVRVLPKEELDAIPKAEYYLATGPKKRFADGSLIKTPTSPDVFYIHDGTRYRISSEIAYITNFGFDWQWIEVVSETVVQKLKEGVDVHGPATLPAPFVYRDYFTGELFISEPRANGTRDVRVYRTDNSFRTDRAMIRNELQARGFMDRGTVLTQKSNTVVPSRDAVASPESSSAASEQSSSVGSARILGGTSAAIPSAITNLSATAGNTSALLSWSAPSANGASITGYIVDYRQTGSSTYTNFSTASSASETITGLTNGTGYDFRVRAQNSVGNAATSNIATATPQGVPSQVTGLGATVSSTEIVLAWTAPSANGSTITDYLIEYKATASSSFQSFSDGISTATGTTVTSLTNGVAYDFVVSAVNSIGTSVSSSVVSSTPIGVPGQVTGLSATASSTQASLSWSAPSANGSAITDYYIEYKQSASSSYSAFADGVTTTASATVTGLTNGTTYDFRVSAINSVGTSTVSAAVSSTPGAIAAAITTLSATTTADGAVTLAWTAPTNNGSSITDYVVEYKNTRDSTYLTYADGTSTATSSALTLSIAGSLYYDFRVSAVNGFGTSSASNLVTSTLSASLANHSVTGGGCPASVLSALSGAAALTDETIPMDSSIYTHANGSQRNFHIYKPTDVSTPRPVVFGWHGAGEDTNAILLTYGLQDLASTSTGPGPAIVILPDDINTTTSTEPDLVYDWAHYDTDVTTADNGPSSNLNLAASSTNPDLIFFDDILRCVHEAYTVDLDRVYSMGHSGGAFFTDVLLMHRSNRLAAIYSGSGGIPSAGGPGAPGYTTSTYSTPAYDRPALIEFGAMGQNNGTGDEVNGLTDVFGQNYHLVSSSIVYADQLIADGHYVLECQGDQNHTPPDPAANGPNIYWPWFTEFPRWVTSTATFNSSGTYPAGFLDGFTTTITCGQGPRGDLGIPRPW